MSDPRIRWGGETNENGKKNLPFGINALILKRQKKVYITIEQKKAIPLFFFHKRGRKSDEEKKLTSASQKRKSYLRFLELD